jgi:putative flippase GtrA
LNRIWHFIKKNFLTKKFLTFGIIGVINTLIHMLVYGVFYNSLAMIAFVSNAIAFVTASTFSYFANAYLTFKPKNKSTMQFSVVFIVFLVRLIISSISAQLFDYMVINWFSIDYEIYPLATYIAPFFASALLIPIAYFALDIVFKKTDIKKNN